MAGAYEELLRESSMRLILAIIAALAAFTVWDGVANESAYRCALMTKIERAADFHGHVRVSWDD